MTSQKGTETSNIMYIPSIANIMVHTTIVTCFFSKSQSLRGKYIVIYAQDVDRGNFKWHTYIITQGKTKGKEDS